MKSLCLLLLACVSAHAADREFKDVVRAISDEFQTRPMHIPLLGLVNTFTAVARPAGTPHIAIAGFENLNARDRVRGNLPEALRRAVGGGWKPFLQVRAYRNGFDANVFGYMHQE